jgi:hypothetical protein
MSQDKKSGTQTPPPSAPAGTPGPEAKPKKKLSLDISDVSEVLERKISP